MSRDLAAEVDALRAEIEMVNARVAANQWQLMHDRFHGFDAIKDDRCPCCGGAVATVDNDHGTGIKLEARR